MGPEFWGYSFGNRILWLITVVSRARDHHGLLMTNTIKFVGVYSITSQDDSIHYETNFIDPIKDSKNFLTRAIDRHTSSIGAAIIYNAKYISKFTHLVLNVILKDEDIESLDDIGINFMCGINRRYIATKSRTYSPYSHGGLNLKSFKHNSISLMP